MRWGLNAQQRAGLGLPDDLEQNSWRFGLRRMLLGYAVGTGDSCDDIEPYDEIGGLDAALIGPLVALLDALEVAHAELSQPAPAAQWGTRLHALLQVFFLAETEHDDYLLVQLQGLCETWLQTCESVGLEDALAVDGGARSLARRPGPGALVPALSGRLGELLHPDAHACHPLQGGVPAGHERW